MAYDKDTFDLLCRVAKLEAELAAIREEQLRQIRDAADKSYVRSGRFLDVDQRPRPGSDREPYRMFSSWRSRSA